MLQAGPVASVHLPKDRVSMSHQGFGFCEFVNDEDAEYACKIMNQIKLYGKPIRVNKVSISSCTISAPINNPQASTDRKQIDVGANLFIGNLDPGVDERLLFDTFSTFGLMMDVAKVSICITVFITLMPFRLPVTTLATQKDMASSNITTLIAQTKLFRL